MATLNVEKKKKIKKRKRRLCGLLFFFSLLFFPWLSGVLDCLLLTIISGEKFRTVTWIQGIQSLVNNKQQLQMWLISESVLLIAIIFYLTEDHAKIELTDVIQITDKIQIPASVGQGQHGTSRFSTEEEKEKMFQTVCYNGKTIPKENYGLVVGMEKENKTEIISCIVDDIHSLCIGATRSGKTRAVILESIWLRGKACGSMIIHDPKGELYLSTEKYLKEQGIHVIVLDFKSPRKGAHYNFMQEINDAVDCDDIPMAIDKTWDFVSVLVGEPKGEPLWTNGEKAVIAAIVLLISIEAPKEFRNLTNVYYFMSYMCRSEGEEGEMPITQFFSKLPDQHPAKGIFAIAELTPERTRSTFFGSALATLQLFTNWNIADMTSKSDFELKDIGRKPTALFMIVPDEKTTFYSLVSIFVNQVYVSLVELANSNGGRVSNPVDFFLDEFGNLPTIPSFGSMLSVGAGRGLRFSLIIQDYQQLEKNYPKDFENIKGNCVVTLYLRTPTLKTLEELSKRTGTYTVQVQSVSDSMSVSGMKGKNDSYSNSANMQSRALLTPGEIGMIDRPYSLIFYAGCYPSIFIAPDLSQYQANKEFGLGDKKYNQRVIMERESARKERARSKLKLWGIWNQYLIKDPNSEERVSFL